jgi:hypothetical protein
MRMIFSDPDLRNTAVRRIVARMGMASATAAIFRKQLLLWRWDQRPDWVDLPGA